jgi:hypothetical protein
MHESIRGVEDEFRREGRSTVQFGRVFGFITLTSESEQWLTVILDTGRSLRNVRDEAVNPVLRSYDPVWLADQLVQETIGNELSMEGWEVIGEDPDAGEREGEHRAIARSSVWIVRAR